MYLKSSLCYWLKKSELRNMEKNWIQIQSSGKLATQGNGNHGGFQGNSGNNNNSYKGGGFIIIQEIIIVGITMASPIIIINIVVSNMVEAMKLVVVNKIGIQISLNANFVVNLGKWYYNATIGLIRTFRAFNRMGHCICHTITRCKL